MKNIFYILISVLFSVLPGQAQETDSLSLPTDNNATTVSNSIQQMEETVSKQAGDSAYIKEDYSSAIQIYEAVLKQGVSYEIYYNLGNSYFKEGQIGKAILNYERALLLNPGNSDIRANLDIARAKTVDKLSPSPEIFYTVWFKALANAKSVDTWAVWSIIFFVLMLLGFVVYFFSKSISIKKIGFASMLLCLMLCIATNSFAIFLKGNIENRDNAIVIAPSVTVRSTPSDGGTSLFVIHEGRKVLIKDNTMREWKEIVLEDGKIGWVSVNVIERI